jgi:hypothetical protein
MPAGAYICVQDPTDGAAVRYAARQIILSPFQEKIFVRMNPRNSYELGGWNFVRTSINIQIKT